MLTSSASQDKENKNEDQLGSEDYISDLSFVHARWELAIDMIIVLLLKGNYMLISMLLNKAMYGIFYLGKSIYYFLLKIAFILLCYKNVIFPHLNRPCTLLL